MREKIRRKRRDKRGRRSGKRLLSDEGMRMNEEEKRREVNGEEKRDM